jgi:hypothetical protein
MSVTATSAKSPQRTRLACAAALVTCTVAAGAYALAPDDTQPQLPSTSSDAVLASTGMHDLEAVKARNMRALGLTASPGPYDDLEANKARSMRALGEHLMARGKPIPGRELTGYKARSMRALGAQIMSR